MKSTKQEQLFSAMSRVSNEVGESAFDGMTISDIAEVILDGGHFTSKECDLMDSVMKESNLSFKGLVKLSVANRSKWF